VAGKEVLFYHFLSEKTQPCHDVALRSKREYTEKCPTENIRWHYTDVRYMKHTIEWSIIFFGQEPQLIGFTIWNTLFRVKPTTDTPTYLRTLQHIRNQVGQPRMQNTLSWIGHRIRTEAFRIIIGPLSQTERCRKIGELYVGEIIKHHRYSPVMKQLRKIPVPSFLVYAFLAQLFSTALYHVFVTFELFSHIDNLLKEIPPGVVSFFMDLLTTGEFESIQTEQTEQTEQTVKELRSITHGTSRPFLYQMVTTFDTFLIRFAAATVDFYTVFRMIKPPKGNSRSVLSLGYHGAAHTLSMVHLLQHPHFGYKVVYQKELSEGPMMRCITIEEPIHLQRDIEEYVDTVRTRNVETSFRPYHTTLRKEKEAREREQHESNLFQMEYNGQGGRQGTRKRRVLKAPKASKAPKAPKAPKASTTKKQCKKKRPVCQWNNLI
jgi:hypothetical protein